MPTNKNALIRYQALDRCFSNPGKNYDIMALLEAVNMALAELDPNTAGIQKRQLYDDIRFMESAQGYHIPLEKTKIGRKVYYRYTDSQFSINNNPINALEAEQLKAAMLVLQRFKGLPQLEWIQELLPKLDQTFLRQSDKQEIMAFENNPYVKGLGFIGPLFNAILHKTTIIISYRPFNKKAFRVVFFPYHIKQYNARWFLLGRNPDYQNLTIFALDRIERLESSDLPYKASKIQFGDYFEDVVGVTLAAGPVETIELKVTENLWHYINTKPLHGSQKIIGQEGAFVRFSLSLIPNFELEKLLLSFGEELEVCAPAHFRAKIKARIQKNSMQYD